MFNHLRRCCLFDFEGVDTSGLERSARLRVYASAQHPIAYGALLDDPPHRDLRGSDPQPPLLVVRGLLIGLGSLSASRTAITATFAGGVALLLARPGQAATPDDASGARGHLFVLPNALGTFKSAFFPHGGIVAEQDNIRRATSCTGTVGWPTSARRWISGASGRSSGAGGSRIVGLVPRANAAILDNQWLDFLLDLGALGSPPSVGLVFRGVWRLGKIARGDPSDLGLLVSRVGRGVLRGGADHLRRVRRHPGDAPVLRPARDRSGCRLEGAGRAGFRPAGHSARTSDGAGVTGRRSARGVSGPS